MAKAAAGAQEAAEAMVAMEAVAAAVQAVAALEVAAAAAAAAVQAAAVVKGVEWKAVQWEAVATEAIRAVAGEAKVKVAAAEAAAAEARAEGWEEESALARVVVDQERAVAAVLVAVDEEADTEAAVVAEAVVVAEAMVVAAAVVVTSAPVVARSTACATDQSLRRSGATLHHAWNCHCAGGLVSIRFDGDFQHVEAAARGQRESRAPMRCPRCTQCAAIEYDDRAWVCAGVGVWLCAGVGRRDDRYRCRATRATDARATREGQSNGNNKLAEVEV